MQAFYHFNYYYLAKLGYLPRSQNTMFCFKIFIN